MSIPLDPKVVLCLDVGSSPVAKSLSLFFCLFVCCQWLVNKQLSQLRRMTHTYLSPRRMVQFATSNGVERAGHLNKHQKFANSSLQCRCRTFNGTSWRLFYCLGEQYSFPPATAVIRADKELLTVITL